MLEDDSAEVSGDPISRRGGGGGEAEELLGGKSLMEDDNIIIGRFVLGVVVAIAIAIARE
jgi:hypothetical protein